MPDSHQHLDQTRVSSGGPKTLVHSTGDVLQNLRVASPCTESWSKMTGDNRARLCDKCQLNVYNISGMSRWQAEELIAHHEGRMCIRYYQRQDGTILTRDCPVGVRAIYQRAAWLASWILFTVLAVYCLLMGRSKPAWSGEQLMGEAPPPVGWTPHPPPVPKIMPPFAPTMGAIAGRREPLPEKASSHDTVQGSEDHSAQLVQITHSKDAG